MARIIGKWENIVDFNISPMGGNRFHRVLSFGGTNVITEWSEDADLLLAVIPGEPDSVLL
jgi:hypothetical protein